MDGIFTEDELKADATSAAEVPEDKGEKQEYRRDDGTFMSAEEIAAAQAKAAPAAEPAKGPEDTPNPNTNDAGSEEGKSKTVPQQALHAEREKRKALEAELAPLKEQLGALQKMREQIASRSVNLTETAPTDDDPHGVEALKRELAELKQSTTRVAQHIDLEAVNNAEMQQLGSVIAQSEVKYREVQPDYDDAISHVVSARAQELALYGLTPPQIQQTISEEATEIVRAAIAQNRDPAEMGYQIALSRGYRPKQAETGKPAATEKTAAQKTLDAIAAAKTQGKSLGGAGGSTPQTLNAEAVLQMSPEEFDALYSTPEGKAMIDSL